MQPSALRRHAPGPSFSNHTPRDWEVIAGYPSQSPEPDMFGVGPGIGMSIATDPIYNDATMGQGPSKTEREKLRKVSSIILQEDSVEQYAERRRPISTISPLLVSKGTLATLSREDSWSMHCAHTNQALYNSISNRDGNSSTMITQNSFLKLPRDNASHDLAYFLKTTGPAAPHRTPSKVDRPRRVVSGRSALRLFKFGGQRRQVTPVQTAHERLNGVLHDDDYQIPDEGGLLPADPIPDQCEQKISSSGKRYLALQPKIDTTMAAEDLPTDVYDGRSILSPDILESHISVRFQDDVTSATGDVLGSYEGVDDFLHALRTQQYTRSDQIDDDRTKSGSSWNQAATRLQWQKNHPTPLRPAASDPPSPIPESAISSTSSNPSDLSDRPQPKPAFDAARALSSDPVSPTHENEPVIPNLSLPKEEFPVKHPTGEKEIEIRHPFPRRMGSHPLLSQRASSIASTMCQRKLSESLNPAESPGPPPPKSPLRLRRDLRMIDSISIHESATRKGTPKIAPSIKSASIFNFDLDAIKATVTTECTGPIKRPKSRDKDKQSTGLKRVQYPTSRKEREERVKNRKLRDRPSSNRTIDSIVNAATPVARQRLRKPRPQIQIPARSTASDITYESPNTNSMSWKRSMPHPLISPVPSRASQESEDDQTGYTPTSPTAYRESRATQLGLQMSPTMLVAEQVPIPKTNSTPKPATIVIKEATKSKAYAPRPRSASLPRSAFKRSRYGDSLHSSPRRRPSPSLRYSPEQIPPLPSRAPTRALPPTPPASGSEKPNIGSKRAQNPTKELSMICDEAPLLSTSSLSKQPTHHLAHIATQRKTSGGQSRDRVSTTTTTRASARISARLEALEKQNALLSAALMAVLKTNGTLNGPIPGLMEPESPRGDSGAGGPMAWENRIARRSAATSHTASSSNGSALEMYMSTRQGGSGR